MQPILSVETMRASDAWTIANRVPGLTLMARAARGIFRAADWPAGTAIVIGPGNNGGDGAALACLLARAGIPCTIYRLSDKASPDNAHYLARAETLGVPILPFAGREAELAAAPAVADCVLGTGFSGPLRGAARQAVEWINRAGENGAFVVSADINSGLNGDTGSADLAVVSDLTVSIGFYKTGLFRGDAPRYIRRLVNVDIGITQQGPAAAFLAPPGAQPGPGQIACPSGCRWDSLPAADDPDDI